MNLHVLRLPKLIAEFRSSAIFGVLIIAMLWAGVLLKYSEDVQGDKRDAERSNHNFAMVFEENVLRSIGEIDKAILYLRRSIETYQGSIDYRSLVNTTDVLSEIINQVAIIDAHGISRGSNASPDPGKVIDVSDREHFRVHLNSNEDKLFTSKPLIGRASEKWSVQFTRRISNKDGSFAGVVVASLNPEHLTKFYDKIDFGSSASIALIGSDGVVRSSGGSAGSFVLGQDLRGTELFRLMQAGSNATFESVKIADREAQLVTVRKVRGHPLWVSVSTNQDEIYKGSLATLQSNSIAAALLTLIILGAIERILRTETKARQKAEQLQLTLENMSQGIMMVTKNLDVAIINRRCGELLDLPPEFIKAPPHFDNLLDYQTRNGTLRDLAILTDQPVDHAGAASIGRSPVVGERVMPNGTVIEVRRVHVPDGSFVHTFTDITKRREAEDRVTRLAAEDPLTGLPNRRVFRSALEAISRGGSPGRDDAEPACDFAVLFLDLDRFKVVNDTLGHRIGDLLLKEVAQRLKCALGSKELLARLGGDEFAIVVPELESRAALEELTQRLVDAVVQPYEIDGYQIRTSISIGLAVGPHDGAATDDLLMAADLALYAVKASSRGSYKFYQKSMNEELRERRHIEMDLREAVERGELELHYQPIIDLRRNAVIGFEALARWNHPRRGLVPPAVFIPIAEDSGLILALGEWALAEACRKALQWREDIKIAVNISPVQLSAPNLPDMVERILRETSLAPNRLELEITERIFLDDSEKTLATLRRLKELGVGICLDDFGTGYSSLSYLRSFPFDKIKIDRAFVSDLSEGTEHVVIVQAVVSIARALGMTTTAEGVETTAQQQFLAALGCDEAQGYLFSRPVPIEKLREMSAEWAISRLAA